MLVHKNYQRLTVLNIDCNLSVACWCTARARYAVFGQTESSWDVRALPVTRDAVPFTLSIYKKPASCADKVCADKDNNFQWIRFYGLFMQRRGRDEAETRQRSVKLPRALFSPPKMFQDHIDLYGFIHSARNSGKKTIYNHDYLDFILLSKPSQEKKGRVFGL